VHAIPSENMASSISFLFPQIGLRAAVECIAAHAFDASPYPLIISIENHCRYRTRKHPHRTCVGLPGHARPRSMNPQSFGLVLARGKLWLRSKKGPFPIVLAKISLHNMYAGLKKRKKNHRFWPKNSCILKISVGIERNGKIFF
jgi:hypothetical protein